MAFLAAAMPYLAAATAVSSAVQQRSAGKEAEYNAKNLASQQEAAGKAAQAESQREAIEEHRKVEYATSRATALAAASGGKVSDPTIQNIIGDLRDEGEYRALSALYSGDTDAELANAQASATRREGKSRRRAANLSSATTILGGASDFAGKYGSKPSSRYSGASSHYSGPR